MKHEVKIAAWRARMSAALPGQEETVRELEAHLRDHIEAKTRAGAMTPEAAFEEGVKRMGEPRVVAREFARGGMRWFEVRPMVVIYGLFGAGYAAASAWMIWRCVAWRASPLMTFHVLVLLGGYLAVIAAGFAGLAMLIAGWRRPSAEREMRALRREVFRLTVAGSGLVPVGIVLGIMWAAQTGPHYRAWSWAPVEIGALSALVSTWLLLWVQMRIKIGHRECAVLAMLGAAVTSIGWFAKGLTPEASVAWVCGAAIFAQGAMAWWQVRARGAAAAE